MAQHDWRESAQVRSEDLVLDQRLLAADVSVLGVHAQSIT